MAVPKSPVGCPMDSLLRLLMGPWTTYILWVLRSNGPTRFGELRRAINGISQRMLTVTLRALERDGLIARQVYPVIPPRVDYSLTPLGRSLLAIVEALTSWSARHVTDVQHARTAYDNAHRD